MDAQLGLLQTETTDSCVLLADDQHVVSRDLQPATSGPDLQPATSGPAVQRAAQPDGHEVD